MKQGPTPWYDTLMAYLHHNGYKCGATDNTLFIKPFGLDIIITQVYVDLNLFRSIDKALSEEFVDVMLKFFEMG